MASNILTTRLLSGILFALALFYLCQGSPTARELHAYSADEDFLLENATLPLHPREDHHAENLLHLLSKRAPPKTVEEGARMAESQLLCYFGSDDSPTQSTWKEEDLRRWYTKGDYFEHYGLPPDKLSFTGGALKKEMEALNLPRQLGDRKLEAFNWEQNKRFEFNGQRVRATGGWYLGVMSVERGFISAEDNQSPRQKADAPYPPLHKMSDVYALEWQRQAGDSKKIKNLRYFLRFHILNDDTLDIIAKITNGYTTLDEWPGNDYPIYQKEKGKVKSRDEGKALLRTPNGVGVAYFLLTNKRMLGKRIPDTVKIWRSPIVDKKNPGGGGRRQERDGKDKEEKVNEDFWVHMLFHIVPYKGI